MKQYGRVRLLKSEPDPDRPLYTLDSFAILVEWHPEDLVEDETFLNNLRLLQVSCPHPTCKAQMFQWCRTPSGKNFATVMHKARWNEAYNRGMWSGLVDLVIPRGW